ncbi:hypothetical protein DSO57_1005592 [Entomophthora muscae]|uniref:Uncharacterized protein n=1 Tax=Entomophthora muscae TaxID=34485 RepID=A0ACC2UTG9_9FUNG|nr:hypothetical protein DSO57_1005592 [Entomophthora muscae]
MFTLSGAQLSKHVLMRLQDKRDVWDHYQLKLQGHFRGHLCFNQIEYGVKFKADNSSSSSQKDTVVNYAYTNPLYLPSKIPDGVLMAVPY